jgi:hypothetical protein
MTHDECWSTLELLDLRQTMTDGVSEAPPDILGCPRCSALLSSLPDIRIPDDRDAPRIGAPPSLVTAPPDRISAGDVWVAVAPDESERRYVVVVIGKRQDTNDGIVVAPTSPDVYEATDLDVKIDDSPLGYPFLVSAWNFGTILRRQLVETLGRLGQEQFAAVKAAYRRALGGDSAEDIEPVGPDIVSTADPRLLWRDEQIHALRLLWRPRRAALVSEESKAEAGERVAAGESLGRFLKQLFLAGEWDEATVAEQSHVSIGEVTKIALDHLDLTDGSDIDTVAKVINGLGLVSEEAEVLLRGSLRRSAGGLRIGTGGPMRRAARSFADVSDERRSNDLFADATSIDDSPRSRGQAMDNYVDATLDRLEKLRRTR